jgi:hypothetical protein
VNDFSLEGCILAFVLLLEGRPGGVILICTRRIVCVAFLFMAFYCSRVWDGRDASGFWVFRKILREVFFRWDDGWMGGVG